MRPLPVAYTAADARDARTIFIFIFLHATTWRGGGIKNKASCLVYTLPLDVDVSRRVDVDVSMLYPFI